MHKEVISDKQGISLIALFIMGSSLVIGIGTEAGRDSYLSILAAVIISFPMLMVYAKILSLFPGKDLFDIVECIFGKFFGKLIAILYIWLSLHLGALVLRDFGEFICNVSLGDTPMIIPMICITFLCVWAVKKGIEVLGRWAQPALLAIIIFIILVAILAIPIMNLDNIYPVLFNGIKPILTGAYSVFSFPFAETVLFSLVFSSLKEKKSSFKVYKWGLIIGAIVLFVTTFIELLVLGESIVEYYYFPAHITVSRIKVAEFLQRIEIIVSIAFLGSGFIKMCICLLGACNGVAKIFKFDDYRFIVTPIALLMFILSLIIFDNIMEIGELTFPTWRYYAFLFQVILPIIILIGAEIKKTRLN